MNISPAKRRFQFLNLCAIVLLFLVILAGGVVRASGSGMGCPDWPKCFGAYIPPTDVSQLPADYKHKYVMGRMKKNIRFAKTLDLFGYSDMAERIREDRSILVPEEFNAVKTWIEYINRLIGALSGLFLLLTAVYSFAYRGANNWIIVASVGNLILVFFQAWLGSIVVSTNLVSWLVTVHMLIALGILALSIYSYHAAKSAGRPKLTVKGLVKVLTLVVLVLSIVQISVGTSVREKVDEVSTHFAGSYRSEWVAKVGQIFTGHRDTALLVLALNVLLYVLIRKSYSRHSIHQQLMSFTFLMILAQIATGIALSYFALPPVAQASHIILASLVFGAQFYLLLNLSRTASVRGMGA